MTSYRSNLDAQAQSLMQSIVKQREEGHNTDCVIAINGSRFRCHSALLAAHSPLLRKMLQSGPDNDKDSYTIIIVSDLREEDGKLVELVINMLYTGKIVATEKHVFKLKKMLRSLGVDLACQEYKPTISEKAISKVCEVDSLHLGWSSEVVNEGPSVEETSNIVPDFIISPIFDEEDENTDIDESVAMDVSVESFGSEEQHGFRTHDQKIEVSIGVKDPNCSKQCNSKCGMVYKNFKDLEKSRLQALFSSDKSIDTKRKLLAHLKSQQDCGLGCETYQINNHAFCLTFLAKVSGTSVFILRSVLSDFWTGVKMYTHGNSGILRSKSSSNMFVAWLKQFCQTYGQSAPDEDVTVLSYWLNKKLLYNMYLEETTGPHLSKSTFYENFKSYFGPNRVDKSLPQVRISKYSSHSVCNICTVLNSNKRQAQSESELKIAQEKINNHKLVFGGARRKIDEIIQSALSFPADNLGRIHKFSMSFKYLTFKFF